MALGRAQASPEPQSPSEGSAPWAGTAPPPPAKQQRWEEGVGREERVGGGGKHTSGKVGINFLVFKSRDQFASRPCSRCSFKGSQSGEAVGHRLPFKVSLPPPPLLLVLHMAGSGSLVSGSYTTLASALRPHLPPWHSPSFWDPAPTSLEAVEKARVWDRTPPGAGPNPTTHVPQKQRFLQGKNQAQATRPGPRQGGQCLMQERPKALSLVEHPIVTGSSLFQPAVPAQATEGVLVLNTKANILGSAQGIRGSPSGLSWLVTVAVHLSPDQVWLGYPHAGQVNFVPEARSPTCCHPM